MILQRILKAKREEVAARKKEIRADVLARRAEELSANGSEASRGFFYRLSEGSNVQIIAEVKRRSPSKGPLKEQIEPASLAVKYETGGAAAVSVLTDEPFFGGTLLDLQKAREAVSLPVLRKDFIIDSYQIDEAKVWGADAVLLIVAALGDSQLKDLLDRSQQLGLDALVEVHTEKELEKALSVGARIVGINNRDLRTFHTTLDVTVRLARHVPKNVVLVSESGIATRDDVIRLAEVGADAILVGETFVRSPQPIDAVAALAGVPTQTRAKAVPYS